MVIVPNLKSGDLSVTNMIATLCSNCTPLLELDNSKYERRTGSRTEPDVMVNHYPKSMARLVCRVEVEAIFVDKGIFIFFSVCSSMMPQEPAVACCWSNGGHDYMVL